MRVDTTDAERPAAGVRAFSDLFGKHIAVSFTVAVAVDLDLPVDLALALPVDFDLAFHLRRGPVVT